MSNLWYQTSNPKKEVIKKLAFGFCKLDESELSDDLLQMKRVKTHPIAKARIVLQDPSPSQAREE